MKKEQMMMLYIFIAVLLVGAPAGLFYYYDNMRVTQLNSMQSKILWVENQKEVDVVKAQVTRKMDEISGAIEALSGKSINAQYAGILENRIIRNYSYSKPSAVDKIKEQFLREARGKESDLALLFRNGNVLAAGKPDLAKLSFKGDTKFLQAIASQKMTDDVDFSNGTAEFYVPVSDTKQRLVSVLYVKENISALVQKVRTDKQSQHGYNFIIDSAGRMLLNTEAAKEGNENVLSYPDIKAVLEDEAGDSGIKEAEYNNLKGLLGYRKLKDMELTSCVFTPYTDYSFMKKKTRQYESSFRDTSFVIPVYGILAAIMLFGIMIMASVSTSPFKPLGRIVKALTHIDDESFQEILPKVKGGDYRKLIDSLVILKGRISAAEEKSQKLSQMSKELEEELSKEASRADAEMSEMRDAIKIAENTKAGLEDRLQKIKDEAELAKKDVQKKLEGDKILLEQKFITAQKEVERLKQEAQKSAGAKVPVEKENMRTDSVLMMNTELKGVLSVIKTYISSVLGGEGKITDAQQQFLGVVINKSARLERLINDLTELAKLEKGDIKLGRQPLEINNIIQDIIFAIQPQADIKKVEMKVDFAPTLPTAYGDASRISSVLSQLMNQAIKVSPRGGKVIVETKVGGKDVQVRLTDFGMSMPQTKAGALFVNFHGPESIAGPEFVNTGLRFPILKAVINNMGGDIWIESEIGKGKTFLISLPKEQGATVTKPVEGAQEPKPSGIKPIASMKMNAMDAPPAQGGIRIQPPQEKIEPLPTVTDLLNFDVPIMEKKANMPGKDVKVPEGLLKNEAGFGKVSAFDKSSADKSQDKSPDKPAPLPELKKPGPMPLPDVLPPLPELEDDKGSDIIK